MAAAASLWLPARAKLNLSLRIVGRRADGYHLLETLFHAVALHDDLVVVRTAREVTLQVTAADAVFLVPATADNLVSRALRAVAQQSGYDGGFAATLHKRIPHGAGLGGGSSDAAAALRLANALLDEPLAADRLHQVALTLGADVPFFLHGGSQWGRGIGEQLSPANIAAQHFVLVVPPYGCATADVYKSFAHLWQQRTATDTVRPIPVPDTSDALLRMGFHNDLQLAAERVRPELAELRCRVATLARRAVGMTGSGSTLFVPCAGNAEAQQCANDLASLGQEGVRLLVTRSAPMGVDRPQPPDGVRGVGDER